MVNIWVDGEAKVLASGDGEGVRGQVRRAVDVAADV